MRPVKPALGLRGVWGAEPHDLAVVRALCARRPKKYFQEKGTAQRGASKK